MCEPVNWKIFKGHDYCPQNDLSLRGTFSDILRNQFSTRVPHISGIVLLLVRIVMWCDSWQSSNSVHYMLPLVLHPPLASRFSMGLFFSLVSWTRFIFHRKVQQERSQWMRSAKHDCGKASSVEVLGTDFVIRRRSPRYNDNFGAGGGVGWMYFSPTFDMFTSLLCSPWFFPGNEGVAHSAELWSKPFIIISNISVYVDILPCVSSSPLLMIGFSCSDIMILVYDDIFYKSKRVDLLITSQFVGCDMNVNGITNNWNFVSQEEVYATFK